MAAVRVQTLDSGTLNTRQQARSKANHLQCNLKHEATALPAHDREFLLQTISPTRGVQIRGFLKEVLTL